MNCSKVVDAITVLAFCLLISFSSIIKPARCYTKPVDIQHHKPIKILEPNIYTGSISVCVPEEAIEQCDNNKFSEEDADTLLQIAMAEAGTEDVNGKALVMLVVLNRVSDESFPDSIKEVVFQDGQFSPVSSGRYWDVEPDEECFEALEMVENLWDESNGALYFESCKGSSWHSRNLTFLFQYGNHKFYK